jgi:hypothetical protein
MNANKATVWAAVVSVCVACGATHAAVIGDKNWADSVTSYTANIQNYNGTLMNASNTWWLTGPSDGDSADTVAGWRSSAPGEYFIVHWNTAIQDVAGNDLTIRFYCGPNAKAAVYASSTGQADSFEEIGKIEVGSTGGAFADVSFDFAGAIDNVQYVKVLRTAAGSNTGMFFDSLAGTVVPEPMTVAMLAIGGVAALRRRE